MRTSRIGRVICLNHGLLQILHLTDPKSAPLVTCSISQACGPNNESISRIKHSATTRHWIQACSWALRSLPLRRAALDKHLQDQTQCHDETLDPKPVPGLFDHCRSDEQHSTRMDPPGEKLLAPSCARRLRGSLLLRRSKVLLAPLLNEGIELVPELCVLNLAQGNEILSLTAAAAAATARKMAASDVAHQDVVRLLSSSLHEYPDAEEGGGPVCSFAGGGGCCFAPPPWLCCFSARLLVAVADCAGAALLLHGLLVADCAGAALLLRGLLVEVADCAGASLLLRGLLVADCAGASLLLHGLLVEVVVLHGCPALEVVLLHGCATLLLHGVALLVLVEVPDCRRCCEVAELLSPSLAMVWGAACYLEVALSFWGVSRSCALDEADARSCAQLEAAPDERFKVMMSSFCDHDGSNISVRNLFLSLAHNAHLVLPPKKPELVDKLSGSILGGRAKMRMVVHHDAMLRVPQENCWPFRSSIIGGADEAVGSIIGRSATLVSPSVRYKARMQHDCNFVL
ncbi:hypothetical protein SELMODRAFT_421981 [Selaginella moellendorffii]|uniref:Uncharacterized protein n=1 Tax=Selaginella moellendorffii TaxID=88036 RepID=D8SGZ1_SELML|nr:hypothetical protein SELMODRAFT_421981 [Selaginella moellendorffii]